MFSIKSFTTLVVLCALSGCSVETSGVKASDASAAEDVVDSTPPVPLNIIELRNSFFSANPSADLFPLVNRQKDGFIFRRDGTVGFAGFRRQNSTLVETSITKSSDNEVCLAPSGSWSGVCLKAFQNSGGRYQVFYVFGNKAQGDYVVSGFGASS